MPPTRATPLSEVVEQQFRTQVERIDGRYYFVGSANAHYELRHRGLAKSEKVRRRPYRFQYPLTALGVRRFRALTDQKAEALGAPKYWLKLGYFTDALSERDSRYWEQRGFVSDGPGRASSRWRNGRRPRKGQTYPPFGPRYAVGDRMVIYVQGHGCPAILEVAAEPRWDPGYVTEHSDGVEGDRWGVVTEVRGTGFEVPLDRAPSLNDIGVTPSSVMRRGHIQLSESSYQRAVHALGGAAQTPKPRRRRARLVPVERGNVEGYETRTRAQTRTARRRESELVRAYKSFMETKGNEIWRNDIPVEDGSSTQSDIFNKTKN